ncbi:plasmid recombination protein [Bacillus paramycoides]|uniref:plasmid recombination protein n=1 Tax=Bacillus paramycoides TaxID=2026194 RepID=UPI0015BE94EC|nr:plasmid recombination protein [Bacillus paramycoides]NWK72573.1 plasmid recombination protein [Bacillus paramycoides]
MLFSISFNQSHQSSLSHNNRENIHGNPGINPSRLDENIYFVQKDIRSVYKDVFQEAVDKYNEKQKRNDRKIQDYYDKIHKNEKTHEQRELVVAVGEGKDDPKYRGAKKEALKQYAEAFQERNSNLAVYNMVLHDDEANPHLHINYVPNFESSRGLTRRVGMDRALQQQGIEGKGTELIANWRALETAYIEDLAKEQIPNFERANVGSHKYMKVRQYKEYADAASTMKKLMHKNKNLMAAGTKRLEELVVDLEDSQQEVKQFNERKVTLHDELNKVERRLEEIKNSEIEIPKVETKKTMFSNDVKVDSVEFERQQEVIKRVAQLPIVIKDKEKELERKNREINSLKDSLSKEQFRNKELVGNNQDLKKENLELKKENKKITDETVRLILVIEMVRKHIAKFVDKIAKFMGREFNYSPADEIIDKAEKEVKEILKEQSKPKRREREDELER